MKDCRVKTKVNILTGFLSEEFNSLMFESAKQNIEGDLFVFKIIFPEEKEAV